LPVRAWQDRFSHLLGILPSEAVRKLQKFLLELLFSAPADSALNCIGERVFRLTEQTQLLVKALSLCLYGCG
jgi:hypothetical protein